MDCWLPRAAMAYMAQELFGLHPCLAMGTPDWRWANLCARDNLLLSDGQLVIACRSAHALDCSMAKPSRVTLCAEPNSSSSS